MCGGGRAFIKRSWCDVKESDAVLDSGPAALVTAFRCCADFLPPSPLVSSEVQLVNDKWADVFLHSTQLDSHILHQYSEVNAMHLTASKKNRPILCSSSIFQGLSPLAFLERTCIYVQYEEVFICTHNLKSCKIIYKNNKLLLSLPYFLAWPVLSRTQRRRPPRL